MTHGYGAYTRGCRCAVCGAAKAEYMRSRRRAARERASLHTQRLAPGLASNPIGIARHFVPGITHGRSGYEERGCRCSACTAAHDAHGGSYYRQRRRATG